MTPAKLHVPNDEEQAAIFDCNSLSSNPLINHNKARINVHIRHPTKQVKRIGIMVYL